MVLSLRNELVDGIKPIDREGRIRHLLTVQLPGGIIDYIETIIQETIYAFSQRSSVRAQRCIEL